MVGAKKRLRQKADEEGKGALLAGRKETPSRIYEIVPDGRKNGKQ